MSRLVTAAAPLLRVRDVGRSIAWFRDTLGFAADPFPTAPPYLFAILFRDGVEIMVRRAAESPSETRTGWDVYLRLASGTIRAVYAHVQRQGGVVRRLEMMPYGCAEFEVQDPDGHRICISERNAAGDGLPPAGEAAEGQE